MTKPQSKLVKKIVHDAKVIVGSLPQKYQAWSAPQCERARVALTHLWMVVDGGSKTLAAKALRKMALEGVEESTPRPSEPQ